MSFIPWGSPLASPRLVSSSVESSALSPLVTLWTTQCLVCETSSPVLRGLWPWDDLEPSLSANFMLCFLYVRKPQGVWFCKPQVFFHFWSGLLAYFSVLWLPRRKGKVNRNITYHTLLVLYVLVTSQSYPVGEMIALSLDGGFGSWGPNISECGTDSGYSSLWTQRTSSIQSLWGPKHKSSFLNVLKYLMGFPGGSVIKNLPASAGDAGSIPGLGRSPREGNDNPFLYSCLENSMDRRAWWATVHGVAKSQT